MINELQQLRDEAIAALGAATDTAALENWRIAYLSRQGKLPVLLEGMKNVPKEARPETGRVANEVKNALNEAFASRQAASAPVAAGMPEDPTLPGRSVESAPLHVVNGMLDRMVGIFQRMGFALAEGPQVETEFNNFDALNTPPDHPARNEQDTFYMDLPPAGGRDGRYLLRSHTSTVQIRTMMGNKPPIKIIAPGRCYRRDEIDATHGLFFHQIEGLVVAEDISLADMKGTMEFFFRELMGPDTRIRFRPHFFPFTEPSFEVDMSQPGFAVKGKEWLEICGCGMVDPNVFKAVGIDSTKYTGFAFGMGVERMVMLLHDIPDLRLYYENDLRFLGQFRG